MSYIRFLVAIIISSAIGDVYGGAQASTEVSFVADDGSTVYAQLFDALGDSSTALFMDKVKLPLLALRPISEMELPSAKAQFESFAGLGIKTYIADPGVHGSSMLVESRTGGDVEATWEIVLAFLAGL